MVATIPATAELTRATNRLTAAFVARAISKVYQMGDIQVHALRSVDLELYDGELVVILGASGSGKSTLLNILGGLDVPTAASGKKKARHPDVRYKHINGNHHGE